MSKKRKMVTFEDYLGEKGVVLRPWQKEASHAMLSVMAHHQSGANGKSFLLQRLSEFISEHGNSFAVPGVCRGCGCTDEDCSGCIAKTGEPCHWVEPNLCSACVDDDQEGAHV